MAVTFEGVLLTVMNAYEILFIIKPHLAEEANEEIMKSFQGWVTSTGGEVTLFKPWGLRELATVFEKHTHGFYVQCQFKCGNPTLAEIKTRLGVSETVFRYLLVTLDSVQSDKNGPEKSARPLRKPLAEKAPVAEA